MKKSEYEFIKDSMTYLKLDDYSDCNYSSIQDETELRKKLGQFIIKHLYNIGVLEYGIEFDYNFFEYALTHGLGAIKKKEGGNYWRPTKNSTKYVKKAHHQKKEHTEGDLIRQDWREHKSIKKDKTKCNYRRSWRRFKKHKQYRIKLKEYKKDAEYFTKKNNTRIF